MPIRDAQIEIATALAQLEGLHLEADGALPPMREPLARRWSRKHVPLLWSPGILWWVAPTGRSLPPARRPTRPRARTLDTPAARRAADLWCAFAPGPCEQGRGETERVQDVPLSGPWADLGRALAIDYLSDKFNQRRKMEGYRHAFEGPTRVEVMRGKGYEVWVVRGSWLRVTERGIEG